MPLRSAFSRCFNKNVLFADNPADDPDSAIARGPAPAANFDHRDSMVNQSCLGGLLLLGAVMGGSRRRASAPRYYEKRDMPSDAATLRRIEACSILASYPYHRKGPLPSGWQQDEGALHALALDVRRTLGGNFKVQRGVIVDSRSGLTAMIFRHPGDRVYMLAFGGTTSGVSATGNAWVRAMPGRNFGTTMRQNFANASAALGVAATSYKQAAALASALQQRLALDPGRREFTLHLTGHSKGGGEAMYAALSAATPLRATVFAPAHLTTGLIAGLRPENLARATELIESYSVLGDPVPALRVWMPRMRGVGAGHHFHGIPFKSSLHRHVYTDKHVAYYVNAHDWKA
jgi:hypothetical protein